MTIIAGPNGAGKSTLRELWRQRLGDVIDADAIAKELNLTDMQAGREAVRRINQCIQNDVSFCLETTLSGNLIFRQIEWAKRQ